MIDGYEEDNEEEELKRADHLLYVTLKYTRTVDVMKNIIKRYISAFDFAVSSGLKKFKVKSSGIAQVRFKQLEKKFKDVKKHYKFYMLLKKIDKAKYTARSEYRKDVSLVITEEMIIKVDTLKEYFDKTKEFVELIKSV